MLHSDQIILLNSNLGTKGGGENSTLQFAKYFSEKYPNKSVIILTSEIKPPTLDSLSVYFGLKMTENVSIETIRISEFKRNIPYLGKFLLYLKFLFRLRNAFLFFNHANISFLFPYAKKNIYLIMFPFTAYWGKIYVRLIKTRLMGFLLSRYDLVIANSEFTQLEIGKAWNGLFSKVVQPYFIPSKHLTRNKSFKQNQIGILTISRFTSEGHSKNQDLLLECFVQLRKTLSPEIQLSYTLIGSLDENSDNDKKYYNSLIEKYGNDSNIRFHPNVSFKELEKAYSEHDIFWLGTGFDRDSLQISPAYYEHFGIVLLEAMSYGLVPFACDRGGPVEILSRFEKSFLVNDLNDLIEKTSLYINLSESEKVLMSKKASETVSYFNENQFVKKMDEIVSIYF